MYSIPIRHITNCPSSINIRLISPIGVTTPKFICSAKVTTGGDSDADEHYSLPPARD